MQRQGPEEEELLQGKPLAASVSRFVQRQEEEEELQMKPLVQRQEEEEELQMKPLVQRQEEEEELQMKPLVQRQEEEEELQMKPLVQRQEEEEELQMKPLVQRQEEEEELLQTARAEGGQKIDARASFDAGADIEGQIQAQKGSGSPLPGDLQGFMGSRFGADFSQVRVHTDSQAAQLNRALSAQAFTHGSDIYMGEGRFDPGSSAGKHLLAHELTHTIQQGASPVRAQRTLEQTTGLAKGVQASSIVNSGMVQLKLALVSGKAHTRLVNGALSGPPKAQIKLINKSPNGALLTKGDTVDLSDTETEHVKDAGGSVAWFRTKNTTAQEYVRGEKVIALEAPTTGVAEEAEGDDLLSEVNENVLGTASEGLDDFGSEIDDSVKDLVKRKKAGETLTDAENAKLGQAESESNKLGTASSVISTASGILGMGMAIKSLAGGEGDWKAKLDAAFDMVSSGLSTVSSLSSFSSKVTQSTQVADTADSASKWSGSFSGMLGTLKSGVTTIKGVVDLIKMIADDKKYSRDEYFAQGSDLLGNALETAKGVVESISAIYDAIGEVATAALETVAVGLDIAIAAVKGIMQGYYLAVSARQWYLMSGREKEMTGEIAGDPQKQAKLKEAQSTYTSNEAMIAKIDDLKKKNDLKIQAIEAQTRVVLAKPTLTMRDQKKLNGLHEKKQNLQNQNNAYDVKKAGHQKAITDYEAANSGMSREKLEEFGLVQELGSANRKRVVRQAVHIGSQLLKIAGGIANLTGLGATAGVALKASAAGVDLSLPFFRTLKQWGRNMAAANLAKGETGVSNKIFNADKNTVAKMEGRKRHAMVILKLSAKLTDYIPSASDPVQKAAQTEVLKRHMAQVEGYIKAAGCDPVVLYRANGNPVEQIKILAKQLSKREFGGG